MSEITETLTAQTEILTAIYADAYRAAFDTLTRWAAGRPQGRNGAFNDPYMSSTARMASRVTGYVNGMPGTEFLDEAAVTRRAAEAAEVLVANYAAKVEMKAEGMTDVRVSRMDASGRFEVTGTKAGHAVRLVQSVVTKVSSKGTWFHQFPALVYIDSTKSTERALKAL